MSAFVPGAGLPLSSSRVFLAGTNTALSARTKGPSQPATNTDICAINFPKIQLPQLPKFGKGGAKSAPPKPKPAAPGKLNIGGRSVTQTPKVQKSGPSASALGDGIPKFYNPTTSRAEFTATAKGQNSTAYDLRIGSSVFPTNRRINENGTFRNMDPYTDDLVWCRPGWSSDEARVGVRVALRNVLGNANLFESEVEELTYSISCVTDNANMKEFVRAVGLSSAYRTRFFESCSNTRFVECNLKHFLGRAPHNQAEVAEHIMIINEQGYNAEINSYVDSDEYDMLFGDSRIPAVNFRGGHKSNNDMNKLAVLSGGYSSSDCVSTKAFLVTGDAAGFSSFGIRKGMPEAWLGENEARNRAGPVMGFDPFAFWNPSLPGLREAQLAWIAKLGNWTKFWYAESAVFKDVMKPQTKHSVEEEEEAAAILKYGSTMAKSYLGCRWAYDVAPVIELLAPTSEESYNGRLSVKMEEISFPIPSDLQQVV